MKLVYEVHLNGVGTIALSNPPHNQLLRPSFEDLAQLEAFLARPELKGVIVKGVGRHFSAGADLDELQRLRTDEPTLTRELEEGKALLEALTFASVPVVASIRGSCLGAGLEIALACHFRVASKNAMLGFPEASLGLMPGLGGTVSILEVLPRSAAMELLLSARHLSADESFELGIVDQVAPTRELEARAESFLDEMVGRREPRVIRSVMTSIHNARRLTREEALREEGRLFLELACKAAEEQLD